VQPVFCWQHCTFSKTIAALRFQVNANAQTHASVIADLQKAEMNGAIKEQTIRTQIADLATSKATADHLIEKLAQQKSEMDTLHQKLHLEFRNLANDILEEKTMKFTEQNKSNMHDLLFPLGEKIKEFEKKVEATYDSELRERVSLKTEIKGLFELNKQLSTEANNLVKALKGDTKQQGNWGELILKKFWNSQD
jgi:DNA recombination protein RmuC